MRGGLTAEEYRWKLIRGAPGLSRPLLPAFPWVITWNSVIHSVVAKTARIFLSCGVLLAFPLAHADEKKPALCRDDAMIVFDASGSMSGNQTLGIPNSQTRIDEVRSALAQVLPNATRLRRVGLISFSGPWPQCNVKLNLKPTPTRQNCIMREVDALVTRGKTALAAAVRTAARPLITATPRVIDVVTDGGGVAADGPGVGQHSSMTPPCG